MEGVQSEQRDAGVTAVGVRPAVQGNSREAGETAGRGHGRFIQRCFVAGHNGMVGRAVIRRLQMEYGYEAVYPRERTDYRAMANVARDLQIAKPDVVVLCAAKVGGISANNTQRADFIRDNLLIQLNWVEAARQFGVRKLILLGSSCIYPRNALQPMIEESLLTGTFEPTNQPYAIAKVAGIELCSSYHRQHGCNFFALMPPNQYGPFDNFREGESHAVASFLRRAYEARGHGDVVQLWGSGSPKRELMHVDDLADAVMFAIERVNATDCVDTGGFLNVGTGEERTIRQLWELIVHISDKAIVTTFDPAKPDGPPRKVMDSSRFKKLGWHHAIQLEEGLRSTWQWMTANWEAPTVRR